MKRIVYTVLGLCTVYLTHAQNFWKQTAPFPFTTDGNISISIDDNNTLFVGTIGSGIFKSDDGAATWETALALTDTAIVKIVCRENNIYAIGSNTFFRSDDNGLNWKRFGVPTAYPLTDIELLSNRKILVSSATIVDFPDSSYEYVGGGVFMSEDKGQHWAQKNTGIGHHKAITHLAVGKGDTIVAAMAGLSHHIGGLYYSTNEGNTWQRINNIRYIHNKEYAIGSIYEVHCLEFNQNNELHFSYEGVEGSSAIMGGLKGSLGVLINEHYFEPVKINMLGYDWFFHPFHSLYFSKKENAVYSSLHTPRSVSYGGPYVNSGNGFTRIQKGIVPINDSYLKLHYVEDNNGKLYAIQHTDYHVYYRDSASEIPTALNKTSRHKIEWNIFPVPASTSLTVSANNETLRSIIVFDVNGNIRYRTLDLNNSEKQIDISSWSNGLYSIRVETKSGAAIQKINVVK